MKIRAGTVFNIDEEIPGYLILERGFCVKFDLITSVIITGKKNRCVTINYGSKNERANLGANFSTKNSNESLKLFREICTKIKSYKNKEK